VVSAITENAELVKYIKDDELKKDFKAIAGKYKVLRFEIGTDKPLTHIAGLGDNFNKILATIS